MVGPAVRTWTRLGYFPNALIPWLVVKDRCHSEAEVVFAGTNVKITNEGALRLDLVYMLGNLLKRSLKAGLLMSLFWRRLLRVNHAHAAYSAFTKGLASRWVYVSCTVLDIDTYLQPLEDVIHCVLIPTLMGRAPPNDFECDLFALPPRWGGLGLCNPICRASQEFSASLKITEPLCSL